MTSSFSYYSSSLNLVYFVVVLSWRFINYHTSVTYFLSNFNYKKIRQFWSNFSYQMLYAIALEPKIPEQQSLIKSCWSYLDASHVKVTQMSIICKSFSCKGIIVRHVNFFSSSWGWKAFQSCFILKKPSLTTIQYSKRIMQTNRINLIDQWSNFVVLCCNMAFNFQIVTHLKNRTIV